MNKLFAAGVLALSAIAAITPEPAHADNYPNKPIKMIVAYGAGSATDILARRIAAPLAEKLGQSIVIENKPGAAATIAAEYVAKSPADGYTLFFATTQTQAVNPHILKDIKYDALKDFEPVANIFDVSTVLVVSSSLGIKNFDELLTYIKKNPSKAVFGSTGFGNVTHLPAAYLEKMTGVDLIHVPYTNLGQLIADVVRGEVTMVFYPPQGVRSFVESGALTPLAWTGAKKSDLFSSVPTMQELGYKDFVFGAWYGVFTPSGVSRDILEKLSDAIAEVVKSPSITEGAASDGVDMTFMPISEFGKFAEDEYERLGAITSLIGFDKGKLKE